MNNNKIKKITIVILILVIFVMSTAYATLYRKLKIGGNAHVSADWKVEVTDIRETETLGQASSVSLPTFTASTVTFHASLVEKTDSITYTIKIKNSGIIDARLSDIVSTQSDATIIYEIGGINKDDVLLAGEEKIVTVKISLSPSTLEGEPVSNEVSIIFNFIQNI